MLYNNLINPLADHDPNRTLSKMGSGLDLNRNVLTGSGVQGSPATSGTSSNLYQNANYNQPPQYLRGNPDMYSLGFAPQRPLGSSSPMPLVPDLGIAFQPNRQNFRYI